MREQKWRRDLLQIPAESVIEIGGLNSSFLVNRAEDASSGIIRLRHGEMAERLKAAVC
jgi:hypothetical protein